MVIVEADRGQDLGVVQHACITQEEARTLLAKYGEEQYEWLMMFSQNNQVGAVNLNAAVYGEANGAANPSQPSTRPPRDAFQNLKPKAIKRMAALHEIRMLMEKEGNEAKAKRGCQHVYQHHLDMEILEAEFQWAAGTMWVRDHSTGERHSILERCSPARRSCICIAPIKPTASHFDNPPCLETDRQARHKDNSSASFVKQPFSAVDCTSTRQNVLKINTQAPPCYSTLLFDSITLAQQHPCLS